MLISQIENKICVELTREDMTELCITYDELDYSNIETRRVLWTLLDNARQALGKEISLTQKMLIEALPKKDGGCAIFFTLSKGHGAKLIKPCDTVLCQGDYNSIYDLCKRLFEEELITSSELFSKDDKLRLFIKSQPDLRDRAYALCCEYCDVIDIKQIAQTREHWQNLIEKDAVEILTNKK